MHSSLFSLFVLFFLALLILWGVQTKQLPDLSRESCLQNMNALRGLFALEIVLGHVVRYENTILLPLGKFMICSVAFFYFVSAFGMAVSFEKKEHYLNLHFLLSKPVFLLGFSVIAFAIGLIVDIACPNDLQYLAPTLFNTFLSKTNWYIWEMIAFYLIFFFIYKYVPRFRVLFVCIITVFLSVVMYLNGFAEAYVASAFAFPMGLACGEYFPYIKKFLFSWRGLFATICLSLFGLLSLMIETESLLSIVFMRNAMCLAAIIIAIFASSYFTIGTNPIARFLCKYSAEIYLAQFIWLTFAESYGWNYMIRMPFVAGATLATAVLMHPAVNTLRKIL